MSEVDFNDNQFIFAATPTRTDFTSIQFPVAVSPVKDLNSRVHITGGNGTKTVIWDLEGNVVKGHGKLKDQFNRVLNKIDILITLEVMITTDELEDGSKRDTAIVFDAMPTHHHLDEEYSLLYRDRLLAVQSFMDLCTPNSRSVIFGNCEAVFYNWDELWVALFETFQGQPGLCTSFEYAAIRSLDSAYTVGETNQWIVATGEELMAKRQEITEAYEQGPTLEEQIQDYVALAQEHLDSTGEIKPLPPGFEVVEGRIVDKRDELGNEVVG